MCIHLITILYEARSALNIHMEYVIYYEEERNSYI